MYLKYCDRNSKRFENLLFDNLDFNYCYERLAKVCEKIKKIVRVNLIAIEAVAQLRLIENCKILD